MGNSVTVDDVIETEDYIIINRDDNVNVNGDNILEKNNMIIEKIDITDTVLYLYFFTGAGGVAKVDFKTVERTNRYLTLISVGSVISFKYVKDTYVDRIIGEIKIAKTIIDEKNIKHVADKLMIQCIDCVGNNIEIIFNKEDIIKKNNLIIKSVYFSKNKNDTYYMALSFYNDSKHFYIGIENNKYDDLLNIISILFPTQSIH